MVTESDAFFTRRQALDRGISDARMHRAVRSGELTRVRRGVLADSTQWSELTAVDRYRATVVAAVAGCGTSAVVSHVSAAAMHNFPLLHPDYDTVYFSENGSGGGHGGARRLHRVALDPGDIVVTSGIALTTPARTAVDVACMGNFEQGVCVVESAMRTGVTRDELLAVLSKLGRRTGIGVARTAIEYADGRTESIGESWSRALMGLWPDVPTPRLQHEFRTVEGYFIARTDFDWDGVLVGEFDGRTKYGSGASDQIIAERQRENRLHALGVHVIRWTWDDLRRPQNLHRLLRAGLDRVGR